MLVELTLNGRKKEFETGANRRLVEILRDENLLGRDDVSTGTKSACLSGHCGACAVIFNDRIIPSCIIPALHINGAEIVTIEGFVHKPGSNEYSDEYLDILRGYEKAGVENCGYCDAGKILLTESLLRRKRKLTRKTIAMAFDSIKCRCTDSARLIKGVLAAAEFRQERLNSL